ncbi:MAG: type II toxin-antitoxin system Phd/YefM family antitoxin [Burkholderiales bacterium]
MSGPINIHEAKTHFSRLIDDVGMGKEFIIAKAGKPVAKLVPLTEKKAPRKPGFLKGKLRISDDFNAPLPEDILKAFEGR